jgi:FlaA1/EpsC-like NDP-sugar epimerase
MTHIELTSIRNFTEGFAATRGQTFVYARHRWQNALAMAAGDTVSLVAAVLIAAAVRYYWLDAHHIPELWWFIFPAWWTGAAMMRLLPSWGLGPVEELRRLTGLLLIVFAATTAALFLSQQGEHVSRLTVTVAFLVATITIPLTRLFVKRMLISSGVWGIPTIVYGAGQTAAKVVRFL